MKDYLKRILSIVLTVVLISGSLAGIQMIASAEGRSAVSSSGLEFSTERTGGSYLQLENTLKEVPIKVEATVKKTVELPTWQLISGNEGYKNGINDSNNFTYSHVIITNEKVTDNQANSEEIVGSDYIKVTTTSEATFSVVKNLSVPVDVSKYDPKDLQLDFWFYTSKGGKVMDGGWVFLGNGNDAFVSTTATAKPIIGKSADSFSSTLSVGWNHIIIPLSQFSTTFNTESGSFDYSQIKCFKFHGVKTTGASEANPVISGLTDVKITVADSAYPAPTPDKNNYTIFSDYSENSQSPLAFCLTENGFPALYYGTQKFICSRNVCDGTEKKVGVSVEADGSVKFYVNGNFVETATEKVTSTIGTPQTKYCIGADADGNQCFDGIISDVKVYGSANNLMGSWNLKMSSNTVSEKIADLSGNNNSAVFVKKVGTFEATIPFECEKIIEGNGTATSTFVYQKEFDPIDASKVNPERLELKMDIEIKNLTNPGDISPLAYFEQGQLELTSGGQADKNERGIEVNTLNLRDGKHEYTVSFVSGTTTNGDIDYSAIDFMRIYMKTFGSDFHDRIRVKIDNVRLVENYSTIPTLFSDSMLFQQKKPMNIWGNGAYGEPVIAALKKEDTLLETQKTVVSEDGTWDLSFAAREGSYDKYQIELTVGGEKRTIKDVVVGELWLAGGQSNMELLVRKDADAETLIKNANNHNIRVFREPTYPYGSSGKQAINPENDVPGAYWGCGDNPINISGMSSVAYTFAKELQKKLNVPVGIINSAIGGTVIEGWQSKEAIDNDKQVKDKLIEYKKYYTETNWSERAGTMSTLYNQKIGPLEGMNLAGVIWYQGETNGSYSEIYDIEFDLLKRSWSKAFGFENEDMPFIFTQVAPYFSPDMGTNQIGYLSMYMERGFKRSAHKNTAMLAVYDLPLVHVKNGVSSHPIHPRAKIPVGERFAQSALNMVYGGGKVYTAPIYTSKEIKDGVVYVTFDYVGDGLKVIGNSNDIHGFTIAGDDGVYVNAKAEIVDENTVKVWNDRVEEPKNVIYAFDNFNQSANLANSEGIPASPFRTVELNDSTLSPNPSVKYFNSQDWMYADKDAWVYDSTYSENDNRCTGYRPSFEVTGGTYSYDSQKKVEGEASLKIAQNGNFTVSPILTYENLSKNWSNFKSLSFMVNASSNAEIKLVLKSGDNSYTVSAVGGKDSVAITSSENSFKNVTFDLTSLTLNGATVEDTSAVLGAVSALEIQVTSKSGTTYFDEFMFGMNTKVDKTEEIKKVIDSVDGFNLQTVNTDNAATLNSLSAKADELIADSDVKAEDKTRLQAAKTTITNLLNRIDDAANALKTDAINNVASVNKNTVKLSDKQAVKDAVSELKTVLEGKYAGNYTDSQKTSINNDISRLEEALKAIEKAESVATQAEELPKLDEVKLNDKEAIDSLKNKLDSLTEHEKALVGTDIFDKVNELYKKVTELYDISHNPKITEGANAKWDVKTSKSVVFRSNADFSEFVKVLIDGKELDSKYYKATSGSTVIEIYSDYLKTLPAGEHSISIVSTNGHADTAFTVLGDNVTSDNGTGNNSGQANTQKQGESVQTGDIQDVGLFVLLLITSLSLLIILTKKRQLVSK